MEGDYQSVMNRVINECIPIKFSELMTIYLYRPVLQTPCF
jgi:hypothetical protein